MSTVFEPEVDDDRITIEDNTPIVQPDSSKSRMANRFLFVAIDVTTPSRKRACKRLQFGGHEVISECLAPTQGFIQKGRITPMVRSGEPILEENAPDGADFFQIPMAPKVEIPGALIMQGMSESPVGAIPAYPGDHFSVLMNGSGSEIDSRKIGLVEITALRGKNYKIERLAPGLSVDRDIWDINRYFFPTFPVVPELLTEFRNLIEKARSETADATLRSIAEDMLASCEVGSLWASETLDAKERLMVQGGPQQGYAYVYDELEESLLVQMGRAKASQGMTKIASQFASIAETGRADVAELATAIKEGNRDFARMLAEELAKVRAVQTVVSDPKPAEPETKPSTKGKQQKSDE